MKTIRNLLALFLLTLMATPEATGYDNKAADANQNGEIEIGDVTTILAIMARGE